MSVGRLMIIGCCLVCVLCCWLLCVFCCLLFVCFVLIDCALVLVVCFGYDVCGACVVGDCLLCVV